MIIIYNIPYVFLHIVQYGLVKFSNFLGIKSTTLTLHLYLFGILIIFYIKNFYTVI